MNIPSEFSEHMRSLIGDEYDELEESLARTREYGLRFNPLKLNPSQEITTDIKNGLGILEKVPWTAEGCYYDPEKHPGRTALHEAGAFYIQEPSAMVVADMLDPRPYERICDLCAAPGGKSTHIAGRMGGRGLLISNEIVADRARILAKNIERMGIPNAIVTNEDPHSFSAHFAGFFHKVVVDAPCSGEGMFRKEEAAVTEWSLDNVKMCSERQKDILDEAAKLVMPGGTLVYSTCTFEPAEDEEVISTFLSKHPEWHIVSADHMDVLDSGRPELMKVPDENMKSAVRLWPHRQKGEGHFAAKLVRDGRYELSLNSEPSRNAKIRDKNAQLYAKISSFLHTELLSEAFYDEYGEDEKSLAGRMSLNGETVILQPTGINPGMLKGVRTISTGLTIAEISRDIYKPAHALAMSLTPAMARYSADLSEEDAAKYLRGETVTKKLNMKSGAYVLICIHGVSMGWAKYVNGVLKNHYPKGLRREVTPLEITV